MRTLQRGIGGKSFCYGKVQLDFTLHLQCPHVATIQQLLVRHGVCNDRFDNLHSSSSVCSRVCMYCGAKIFAHFKADQPCRTVLKLIQHAAPKTLHQYMLYKVFNHCASRHHKISPIAASKLFVLMLQCSHAICSHNKATQLTGP